MRSAHADAAIAVGGAPVVLVTIVSKVETWRVSSAPIDVPDVNGSGGTIQFHTGLIEVSEVEVEYDSFAVGGTVASSMSMTIVLPAGTNPTANEHAWYSMFAASVEVARIWRGEDYGARTPILASARVTALTHGIEGQPIKITIDNSGAVAGASAVDASRDMGVYDTDAIGFTSLDGKRFPIAVGDCYKVPVYKIGTLYDAARNAVVMMGSHASHVDASNVTWYVDGAALSIAETIVNDEDGDGNPVLIAHVATGGEFEAADGAYTVTYGAGAVDAARDGTRAARGAAEVLSWFLSRSGVAVDWGACHRALTLLGGWNLYVFQDREADALRVIRDRIMPLLPLRERSSADGLVLDYVDPTSAPVSFALTVGQELIDTGSAVEWTDPDACRNDFTLEYAYDHFSGTYDDRVTLGAEDERCRYSRQVFGVRSAPTIQCTTTADATTAARMLRWQAVRLALPRRLVSYDVDPSAYWLHEGMVGTVTDPARSLAATPAILARWRPGGSPFRATFELVDRPPVSRI